MLELALQYGLPYLVSSLATCWAVDKLEQCAITPWAGVPLEWLAENVSYYAVAFPCEKFVPTENHVLGSDPQSLRRLKVIEALDMVVRIGLLILAHHLPYEYRSAAAFWLSMFADASFLLSLNRSHRLLEIYDQTVYGWSNRPRPLVLAF